VPKPRKSDVLTDVGLLAMVVIWGINFSVVKLALIELEPHAFNALRFPLACVALYAVVRVRGLSLRPAARDVPALILLGVFGNVVYQWLFILGIDATLAGNAAILLATVPVWTALISSRLGPERPTRAVWLGVVGTLAGMVLVVAGGATDTGLRAETLRGDLLMFLAAVAWAIYTVGSSRLVLQYGALRVTAWTVWIGTAGLLVMGAPALARTPFTTLSPATWGAVVYAGLLALAIAYVAWYRGVERLGSSRTAVYANLVPVVALVSAWLWLGERPGVLQLIGAGLVIASLTVARLTPSSTQPAEPSP
jgi:drug/metabolite transporter (DMT)-like permease